jgi:hypothetical protein
MVYRPWTLAGSAGSFKLTPREVVNQPRGQKSDRDIRLWCPRIVLKACDCDEAAVSTAHRSGTCHIHSIDLKDDSRGQASRIIMNLVEYLVLTAGVPDGRHGEKR